MTVEPTKEKTTMTETRSNTTLECFAELKAAAGDLRSAVVAEIRGALGKLEKMLAVLAAALILAPAIAAAQTSTPDVQASTTTFWHTPEGAEDGEEFPLVELAPTGEVTVRGDVDHAIRKLMQFARSEMLKRSSCEQDMSYARGGLIQMIRALGIEAGSSGQKAEASGGTPAEDITEAEGEEPAQ